MEPTRQAVMHALHAASDRFITLVESLDPADATRPVPRLEWNVGETVAHVLTVVRRGFADRRRSASAAETEDLNAACLEETPERDLAALAALLRQDVHTVLDLVFPKIPEDRVFPFHGGVTTTMTPALRIVLGEFLIHGYDAAAAVGRSWSIPEDEAVLLVPGELLGAWVRPDAPEERYELRLDPAPPVVFEVGPRRLRVLEADGDEDAVIEMGLLSFVLTFYGRVPPEDPVLRRMLSRFVPS